MVLKRACDADDVDVEMIGAWHRSAWVLDTTGQLAIPDRHFWHRVRPAARVKAHNCRRIVPLHIQLALASVDERGGRYWYRLEASP